MPNLVILIPFDPDPECDLDQSATQMMDFFNSIQNHLLGENVGAVVASIDVVFLGTDYQCQPGDYVIIFAHGAAEDSELSNNQGQTATMDEAIAELAQIGAQNAARLLCMCCYSGSPQHIGPVWRAANPNQPTYAGACPISNLYSTTRTQIRAVCAALLPLP